MSAVLLSLMLAAAPPQKSHADEVLRTACLLWAADPENPWALAHGITALGPRFLASDGRVAAEVVMHDFLLSATLPDAGADAKPLYGFRRFTKDGTPIEPHTNLLAKTLVAEAKLPLSRSFETQVGKVSLQQLLDSVKAGFRHVPQSEPYWHDVGWTLSLFAATQKPGTRWTTPDGTQIELDRVFDDALSELERESGDLERGLKAHAPQVDKRKQGLYAHSCGGLHFVQGVLSWARFPEVRKRWGERLEQQLAIHFYRLESERRQYDAALQKATGAMIEYRLPILVQMLKFYGHWLETVALFEQQLHWKPTAEQQRDVQRAKAYLDVAVRELEAAKAFSSMDELRRTKPQVYLDLIGDSCHAVHGLEALK